MIMSKTWVNRFVTNINLISVSVQFKYNFPTSKASREVANLNERKNPHTPVNGVKEYIFPVVFGNKNWLHYIFYLILKYPKNKKQFQERFASLATRAIFVRLFSPFLTK